MSDDNQLTDQAHQAADQVPPPKSPEATKTAVDAAAPKRRGRPSKSRGASKTADSGSAKWTIRGVAPTIRKLALEAADSRNMTLGDWLEDAIRAAAQVQTSAESTQTSAGLPAERVPPALQKAL